MKPLRTRPVARRDAQDAAGYYNREAGRRVARQFVEAVEVGLLTITTTPASGSPRYAHILDMPGLRVHPLKRFPYLVFYVEHVDHIDILRILHGARHIPESLRTDLDA